jgi:hypothetical protein
MDLKESRFFDYNVLNITSGVNFVRPSWDNKLLIFLPSRINNELSESKFVSTKNVDDLKLKLRDSKSYSNLVSTFGGWFKLFNTVEVKSKKLTHVFAVQEIDNTYKDVNLIEEDHPIYGFYKFSRKTLQGLTDPPYRVRLGYMILVPGYVIVRESKFLNRKENSVITLFNSAVKSFLKELVTFTNNAINNNTLDMIDFKNHGFMVAVAESSFFNDDHDSEEFKSYSVKMSKAIDFVNVLDSSELYPQYSSIPLLSWDSVVSPFDKDREFNHLINLDTIPYKYIYDFIVSRTDTTPQILSRVEAKKKLVEAAVNNNVPLSTPTPTSFFSKFKPEEVPDIENMNKSLSELDVNSLPEPLRKLIEENKIRVET